MGSPAEGQCPPDVCESPSPASRGRSEVGPHQLTCWRAGRGGGTFHSCCLQPGVWEAGKT